ncbi:MAG: hypothetical protein CMM50_10610 [Rhodospirillaceae bacterium]|nr:hypothetical protein [Rhodospirillaceae bacterium]|tara:strand:- start:91 stop:759 length:669 start_codon:yes stop_codon:yes gene_type:complete
MDGDTLTVNEEAGETGGSRRRCIVSGEVRDKAELLRFVATPERQIVPDVAGNLPGRGAWIKADRGLIERAMAKNLFARAMKGAVSVDPKLADLAASLIEARCLRWLGLARRTGAAITGFEKVRGALKQGDVRILVEAHDAAADGRDKLARLAAAVAPGIAHVALFDAATLSEAMGQPHVVHAVVMAGPLAESFLADAARLQGLRADAGRTNGIERVEGPATK